MTETCNVCRYSVEPPEDPEGETIFCRRFPPTITSLVPAPLSVSFPITKRDWWCGEFKRKPTRNPK